MILFKKIRWQNFLSTGNVMTEIDLERNKSTLIVGENGAGKSTMLDALHFALFGKPFRNINKPQLVNSITGKHTLVEVEFSIGKKQYLIRRGIKPAIFDIVIDDELLDQNASAREYQDVLEKTILRMNPKSFSQIVVLGSANFVPFMQLPAQHRRDVIEDLLDIQIFSVMNSLLKDKQSNNRSAVLDTDYKIDLCEQKIELHKKHIETLNRNNSAIIKQKEDKVKEYQQAIHDIMADNKDLSSQVAELVETIADSDKLNRRISKIKDMEVQLNNRIKKLDKDIQFFHDHDNCPTCQQGIDHDFKQMTITKRQTKQQEVAEALTELENEYSKANTRIEQIEKTNQQINKLNSSIADNNTQIQFNNNYIINLQREIEDLKKDHDNDTTSLDELRQLKKDLVDHKETKQRLIFEKDLHDVASYVLKDTGIKTKIIKQYVPVMNKLINKYLAAMDFFVQFELDETFNETIRSRFRDDFSYASFSEGEKMRIDLSLMFTWRAIAKLRNSASTNLLIMDEVFDSSLDAGGTEEFMKILDTLTADTNTFVISHKGDQLYDKFHSVIKFEKHANFSRIAA
jgi:DNA repair exonuclease SbcCD ATPase subunit